MLICVIEFLEFHEENQKQPINVDILATKAIRCQLTDRH